MAYTTTNFKGTPVTYTLVNDGTFAIAQFHYQGTLFRILPMFPGYAFAEEGNVLSFKRKRPKYLTPGKTAAGRYWYVNIGRGDLGRSQLVHRLVAFAFHPNSNPKVQIQVNHIDGNPANNAASNLEWVTPAENVRHAKALQNASGHAQTVLTKNEKRMISNLHAGGMTMHSIKRLMGLPYDSVRRYINTTKRIHTNKHAA